MNTSPEQLMISQLMKNQKINDLLEMASKYVDCDEECQQNKKSQELYQKFSESQDNLKNASKKLENNKKKYYVYTYGEEYYRKIKNDELNENAKIISEELMNEFNEQIKNATIMNSLYVTTLKTNGSCLDEYPELQLFINKKLSNEFRELGVNSREAYYTDISTDRIKLWGKFLLYIYYFCIIIFMIFCFPNDTKKLIFYFGIPIALFFLYPIVIQHLTFYIYNNKFNIFFMILYIILILTILLFIFYKMATTFKIILTNIIDLFQKKYI